MGASKLTDEQKEQLVYEYLVDGCVTTAEIGKRFGVSQSTACRIISESQTLRKLEARASVAAARAKIRAQLNADELMRLTIEDAKKTREDKFGHLHQNARRDVLDRAGVRVAKEEDNTLTIKFADGLGFELGETEQAQIVKE